MRWVWLAVVLSAFAAAQPLNAQVPPETPPPPAEPPLPPDTPPDPDDPPAPDEPPVPDPPILIPIPPEQVAGDTIPEEVRAAAAALAPIPAMPRFPVAPRSGWDVARWEWGPDELARLPGMTLIEFLERLPGNVAFRPGGFGRPAGLTALGMGGGRVRVLIDGFALDPHDAADYPLETISLVDLQTVRVERSLSEIRVHIETFALRDPEPHSQVEMGTGVFQTRMLRALFSRGFGDRSVATGAFDLATTAGIGVREDYRHSNAVVRWNYLPTETAGIQFEWRRTIIDRRGQIFPQQTTRDDLVLRGRTAIGERLTLDAIVGRSSAEEDEALRELPPRLTTLQAAARAAFSTQALHAQGTLRGRTRGDVPIAAPGLEAEGSVAFRPLEQVHLEGGALIVSGDGQSAASSRMGASVHPLAGLSLFGSAELGTRFVPRLVSRAIPDEAAEDSIFVHEIQPFTSDASGVRAGAEVAGGFGSVGVAAFRTSAAAFAGFGLPFDRDLPPLAVPAETGVESYFRLPVPRTEGALQLAGSYTRWLGGVARPYAPADLGRMALEFHGVYIGGQLEPSIRLEGVRQGEVRVASGPGDPFGLVMPTFHAMNFSLQIRIIDVQAFLFWDNVLAAPVGMPLIDGPQPSPRIVYGASWRFRN